MKSFQNNQKTRGLMRIPLLQRALNDPDITIFERALDSNWYYEKLVPYNVSGFNPYSRKMYINRISAISSWIKAGMKNDRDYNEGNFLVREALFLIHDYLHCWAVLCIQSEMPELKLGYGEINADTFEDYIFCHLLTEAAATIGLDYWYLATINLSEFCNLGTPTVCLTASYHEDDLNEYRQYNPKLNVQDPKMFEALAYFYCIGEFPGFSTQDLKQSPKLHFWLDHELKYGEQQRVFTRSWLSYLSNGRVKVKPDGLVKAVHCKKDWQKRLIKLMGQKLWELVKEHKYEAWALPKKNIESWKSSSDQPLDYRFVNICSVGTDRASEIQDGLHPNRNLSYFYSQYVSSREFEAFPKENLGLLKLIRDEGTAENLVQWMKLLQMQPLKPFKKEPSDFLFVA